MKFIIALALFNTASAASISISDELAEFALREHFDVFATAHGKAYENLEEREARFLTFVENLEEVVVKNLALRLAGEDEIHGITKFSDWTREEFVHMVGGMTTRAPFDAGNVTVATPLFDAANVPAAFDWRAEGKVTPVKDQKQCGSCWAHSAVETLESQYAIRGGELTAFSVQQVTSCDTVDAGCGGGWYYTAWESYIESSAKGLATEAAYPYDAETAAGTASACKQPLEDAIVQGTDVASYSWATTPCSSFFCKRQDEATLMANIASFGPVSIAADASEWSSYSSGVMTSSSCKSSALKLDHAIQIVGYDSAASPPYWIVRNSWNTDWGLDGYMHLKMGENTCGLADKAAMVTLA